MKRLIVLVALVSVLAGLVLLGISDTSASIADANIPDNQITSSQSEEDNSDSASATITITWTTAPLPDE